MRDVGCSVGLFKGVGEGRGESRDAFVNVMWREGCSPTGFNSEGVGVMKVRVVAREEDA